MQKKQSVLGIFLVFLSILIAAPPNIFGYEAVNTPTQDRFSEEELDQMLAPIALYPDSLLAQMLMAATYPLEVVEAARWVGKNPSLQGELLDQALQDKDWDVSVKSLAHFPDVLAMMDEKIEWTTRVGDAFLAQKDDVMDTIQDLRAKAEAAGNLQSTREQKVVNEQGEIEIEPADPGVIYVPVYDPFWVYGPWWYPAYPPYVFYYPGIAITNGFFGFAFGFAAGFGFGWCDWDWHHHDIRIDFDRIGNFHRFDHNRFHGRERWEHNSGHRRGVAYWDRDTSHRFGQSPERSIQNRREVRGYADESPNRQNMFNQDRQEINRGDLHSREGARDNQSGLRERSERNDGVVRERREMGGTGSTQGMQGGHEKNMVNHNRQEINRGDSQGVRGNESGSRKGSERNDRVVRERNEVSGLNSTQGIQRRREESGIRSRQGVREQHPSALSGFGDGKNTRMESNRGQFSRESSRGGSRNGGGRGSVGSVDSRGIGGRGSHGGDRGFSGSGDSPGSGGGVSHGGSGGSHSGGGFGGGDSRGGEGRGR